MHVYLHGFIDWSIVLSWLLGAVPIRDMLHFNMKLDVASTNIISIHNPQKNVIS